MAVVKKRPNKCTVPSKFCPGCGHGIVARVVAEVIEEKGYEKSNIMTVAVGCSCNLYTLEGDLLQCAHGRAAASARGIKAVKPETLVISYQGDGDAYVIGIEHTINAAYQKSNITMITINNSNFGMTGGQLAWTTLPGQYTTTTPHGRDVNGPLPIQVPEMIANNLSPAFVARGSVVSPAEINKLKKYVSEAIDAQMNNEGFSMVEVICPCPTNWGMSIDKAYEHAANEITKYYPLGILKAREGKE